MQGLLSGQDADGAAPFEESVEGQLRRQNGGERHQNERDDECHAALFFHGLRPPFNGVAATPPDTPSHPATSMSRRMRPQSLNSMMSSTATGRVQRLSVGERVGGGHWLCQV